MNSNTVLPDCTAVRSRWPSRTPVRCACPGMTLIELMIGLTMMTTLMAAIAVAFDAGLRSYSDNQDLIVASRSARIVMNTMATTIRAAWNDPDPNASLAIDVSADGTQCSLVDAGGRDIVYFYDSDAARLEISIDGGANWNVMLEGVSAIPGDTGIFTATDPEDTSFEPGTVGRIDIRFNIQQGRTTYPVCTAVVPRNIVYN